MLLDRLAQTWSALGATPSRLAKRRLIADVLGETPDADLETVVAYLSGSLRQRRTGVGGPLAAGPAAAGGRAGPHCRRGGRGVRADRRAVGAGVGRGPVHGR